MAWLRCASLFSNKELWALIQNIDEHVLTDWKTRLIKKQKNIPQYLRKNHHHVGFLFALTWPEESVFYVCVGARDRTSKGPVSAYKQLSLCGKPPIAPEESTEFAKSLRRTAPPIKCRTDNLEQIVWSNSLLEFAGAAYDNSSNWRGALQLSTRQSLGVASGSQHCKSCQRQKVIKSNLIICVN